MSKIAQHLKSSGSLLESLEAIKNYRAFVTIALSGIASFLVMSMFMYLSTKLGMNGNSGMAMINGIIGTLAAAVIFLAGLSATGILLMDQAKGDEVRSISAAAFAGLVTLPSIIALIVLLAIIAISVAIVLAIILLICKIPVIGPLLYAFVYPVSVVSLGVLFFAYVNVIAPLSLPAIWDGTGVLKVVAKLFSLARTNLLPVVIFQILLLMIVWLTALVTFGVLAYGLFMVTPLSMMILPSGNTSQLMGLFTGMMMGAGIGEGGDGGIAYLVAAGFGGAILVMLAASVPILTLIMGDCIIYLNFVRHQETDQFESIVRSKVSEFKEKAADARTQLANHSLNIKQPAAEAKSPTCPKCNQPVAAGDLFCGNCGARQN